MSKWLAGPSYLNTHNPFANHNPLVRSERKIGRNEQCPCSSGKKFKKCHGGGEDE